MQRKTKQNTSVTSLNKNLSIQFSLDGFSFCITDIDTKSIVTFTSYSFDVSIPTPELLLERIVQIFNQDKDLQQDFETIKVIHQNNLSTLVPNKYFDESKLKTYLDYNIKTLADDYIAFDDINAIEAKTIYIPFVNINNYLFQNFGEFEFSHHATILIDKIINQSKLNQEKQFFVNVAKKNIDIVVTQGANLILYNSFQYNTKEDFIYYILFVAEQLGLDTNEFKLTFLGDIELEDDNYKITYEYVRNIDFIKPSSDFFSSSDDFLNHSNYILVS